AGLEVAMSDHEHLSERRGGHRDATHRRRKRSSILAVAIFSVIAAGSTTVLLNRTGAIAEPGMPKAHPKELAPFDHRILANIQAMTDDGRNTFRFDTFGDEAFWGDQLQLHKAIEGSKFGGTGPGLSPNAAVGLGLKVDADALPGHKVKGDLDDPATTLDLLKANAVLGLTGFFNTDGSLKSVGIQCALCHSTVDDPSGVGHRLDGWANRDLDPGKIIALAPNLTPFANLLGVSVAT